MPAAFPTWTHVIMAISVALGQVGGIDWSTGLIGNCHANRRFI